MISPWRYQGIGIQLPFRRPGNATDYDATKIGFSRAMFAAINGTLDQVEVDYDERAARVLS